MLFDEINIDTVTQDNELYVNVEQLRDHLLGSSELFSQETAALAREFGISKDEKYYSMGLIHGMLSVATMLKQGDQEFKFDSVETVEDLMKGFWSENRTDD